MILIRILVGFVNWRVDSLAILTLHFSFRNSVSHHLLEISCTSSGEVYSFLGLAHFMLDWTKAFNGFYCYCMSDICCGRGSCFGPLPLTTEDEVKGVISSPHFWQETNATSRTSSLKRIKQRLSWRYFWYDSYLVANILFSGLAVVCWAGGIQQREWVFSHTSCIGVLLTEYCLSWFLPEPLLPISSVYYLILFQ